MDWKENNRLKSLNWTDILKTSSDNEYDSDETCCDVNEDLINQYEAKGVDCDKESAQQCVNHNIKTDRPTIEIPQTLIKNIPLDVKCVEQKQPKSNDNAFKEREINQQQETIFGENKVSELTHPEEEIDHRDIMVNGSALSEDESTQKVQRRPGRPRKPPKVLSTKKLMPKRNCKSLYFNNSQSSKEEAEYGSLSGTEDSELTECETLEFKSIPTVNKLDNKPKHEAKRTVKKTSKRGRKRRDASNSSNSLKDLQGINSALKVIEDKVERWISGVEGNSPTRQQAFEMLAESQTFTKLLKEHQRNQSSMCSIKNDAYPVKLLLKRAKIVSVVIDKTIAEADRLMNLEESTDFDPETKSQQDIQINEENLEDSDLKPILKQMVGSEESSDYHNKHVSFNDNIEYHYFPIDDCSIDVIINASQEHVSNRKLNNGVDHNNEKEKTILSTLNRVTQKEITSNVKEREIEEHTTAINNGTNRSAGEEMFNCEPGTNTPRTDQIIKTNIFEKNNNKININTKDQCQSKHEEYLINLNNKDSNIDMTKSERTSDKKNDSPPESQNGIPSKLIKENNSNSEDLLRNNQSENQLSTQQILTDNDDGIQSEASTADENSFGFSKIEKLSDNLAWTKITIMSIKSITIRDNDDILDASFSSEDFKW